MKTTIEGLVSGVFPSGAQAEAAILDLRRQGVADDEMGLVVPEPGRYRVEEHESEEIGQGIATGAAIGAPLGALAGLALAAVVVPGVGVLGLTGLTIGLLEGGLWGAFIGTFGGLVTRIARGADDDHWYEIPVGSHEVVVMALAGARLVDVHETMQRHGARCFLSAVREQAGIETVPASH